MNKYLVIRKNMWISFIDVSVWLLNIVLYIHSIACVLLCFTCGCIMFSRQFFMSSKVFWVLRLGDKKKKKKKLNHNRDGYAILCGILWGI